MKDPVIKAYMASFDADLRIPYLEKKTLVNGVTIVASLYKGSASKKYYCLAVIINNGEYLFDEGIGYSRYYDSEQVMKVDVVQETLDSIKQQLLIRQRLLNYIETNKNLPSVLSVAYNKTLIIYYTKKGKLLVSQLESGSMTLDLPEEELDNLKSLMKEFSISIIGPKEEGYNGYKLIT